MRQPLNINGVIYLRVTHNPKKLHKQCYYRFEKYRNGLTIRDALLLGVTRNDLKWDTDHDFIRVEGGLFLDRS